jgi:uncharacterized membrane protein HdeD (DUF308 family)
MEIKKTKWSGLAINGSVALVIGLIFIFLPHTLTLSIVSIFGAILSITGITMLFTSFFKQKQTGAINLFFIIQGIINLGLGAIMVFNPKLMIDFIMFVIGVWALAIGLFQILYALKIRKLVNYGILLIISGVIFGAIGITMIISPELVIATLLSIIGIFISILGVVLLYFSYSVYKYNKETPIEIIDENISNSN